MQDQLPDGLLIRILNQAELCKNKTDDGEELVWLPLEEIASIEIKPTFLKENISNVINERDR